jgi:hypothetical protein
MYDVYIFIQLKFERTLAFISDPRGMMEVWIPIGLGDEEPDMQLICLNDRDD